MVLARRVGGFIYHRPLQQPQVAPARELPWQSGVRPLWAVHVPLHPLDNLLSGLSDERLWVRSRHLLASLPNVVPVSDTLFSSEILCQVTNTSGICLATPTHNCHVQKYSMLALNRESHFEAFDVTAAFWWECTSSNAQRGFWRKGPSGACSTARSAAVLTSCRTNDGQQCPAAQWNNNRGSLPRDSNRTPAHTVCRQTQ